VVHIQPDAVALRLGESVDVVVRADETLFFGRPPGEPRCVLLVEVGHHQSGLQKRCGAGAVVVDAWTLDDAVEVGAGHHDVVLVPARQLRDDVVVGAGLGLNGYPCRLGLRERFAVGEARAHDGDGYRRNSAPGRRDSIANNQGFPVRSVPLVEDDDPRCAGGLGVHRLESDAASTGISAMLPAGKPAKSSGPSGSSTIGAPTVGSVKAPSQPLGRDPAEA
jgi:hypothetical protein